MFLESFKITGIAVGQIFLLGAIGYFLVKKNILGPEGLGAVSRLVIEITLPVLIFTQLVKDFSFSLYPNWWLFPLISAGITIAGLLLGGLFVTFIKGHQHKAQFLSLIAFQNSGYLPLALIAALLPADKRPEMFIYLFLFLIGFNLVIWSFGVHFLTSYKLKKFELGSMFSPPVVAALLGLVTVGLGINRFLPDAALRPLRLVGDCTLPLAMFVVGGNLSEIRLARIDKTAVFLIILAKLIILPAVGLALLIKFQRLGLLGLLILMQLAMPPATSLSVIVHHYKREDLLISQGVFWGHIAGIITIPLFLILYFSFCRI